MRRLLILLLVLFVEPASASAQALKDLVRGPSTELIEREAVEPAILASFQRAVLDIAEEAGLLGEGRSMEKLEPAREIGREFQARLDALFSEMLGDGFLTAAEVQLEVLELRESHLDRLREDLEALAAGRPLPPHRAPDEGFWTWSGKMGRYVLLERNPASRWLWFLGTLAVGAVLAVVVQRSLHAARQRSRAAGHGLIANTFGSVRGPAATAVFFGSLWIAVGMIWLPTGATATLERIAQLFLIVAGCWLVWALCGDIAGGIGKALGRFALTFEKQDVVILSKALRAIALACLAIVVLDQAFDIDFKTFIAGFGVMGLILTLAMQDTLKNVVASVVIHMQKPFQIGQLVEFKDYFGTIEDIGFRSSNIRTLDGHLVSVPNSMFVSEVVDNVDERQFIRRRFRIDLPYDTPAEKVQEAVDILREILEPADWQASGNEPQIHFDEFGDYSLRLLVQYHFGQADYWKAKAKATEVNQQILDRFRAAGIEFAFPTQTLEIASGGVQSEVVESEDERGPASAGAH